jgi:hypothetical protein
MSCENTILRQPVSEKKEFHLGVLVLPIVLSFVYVTDVKLIEKIFSLGCLVIILSCLCYTCKFIENISLGCLVFGFLVLPIILF